MTKESTVSPYSRLIMRETFNDEATVRRNGGTPTDVTFANGVGSFNGTSSYVLKKKNLKGTYSIRMRFISQTPTANALLADFRNGDSSGTGYFIYNGSADGITGSSGTFYVDGVLGNDVTSSNKEFVLSGITIDSFEMYIMRRITSSSFSTGELDLFEIYQGTLTESEVKNLYENKWNKEQNFGSNLLIDFDSTRGTLSDKTVGNTVGDDLLSGWDFTSGWSASGTATINDADTFTTTGTGGVYKSLLTVGKKYRIYFKGDTTAASIQFTNLTGSPYMSAVSGTFNTISEFTAVSDGFAYIKTTGGGVNNITSLKIYEIKPDLSATDVSIKKIGQSYSADFNGTTSLIDTGTDMISTKSVTIMAWIKFYGYGELGAGRIITNDKLELFGASSGKYGFKSDALTTAISNVDLILNKKQFVAVTRASDGTANFYIGDKSNAPALSGSADQNSGTPAAGTTNIIIGNNSGATRTFDGLIPQISIVENILSLQQITQYWSETLKHING